MGEISEKYRKLVRSSRVIALLTSSGYKNMGQEAVVCQIAREIKHISPASRIYANSFNPKLSGKINNLPGLSFYKNSIFPFFILFADLVVVAGDEISSKRLDKYYPVFLNYLEGKYRVFMAALALLFRKKTAFYKIGLNTFQANFPKILLRYALQNSDLIIVRDKKSRMVIKTLLNNPSIDIILSNDPAYDLNTGCAKAQKINSSIGISLADPLDFVKERTLISFIRNLLSQNREHEYHFFIFARHPFIKEENDMVFTERVISQLENPKLKIKLYFNNNPIEVKKEVGKMDFFIAMRLHAAIFADSLKIPHLIIPANEKTSFFFSGNPRLAKYEDLKKYIKLRKFKFNLLKKA